MGIVKIKIRRTSEEGFLVILTATNREYETEGFLLPLPPELETSFTQWQSAYRQIEDVRSCIAPAPGLRLTPISVTVHSNLEHTQALKTNLNEWLNSGDSKWQPIRDGLIAIAVHPSLKIEGLTVEQIKGIYTGTITNWSQIGGLDVKITPLSRTLNSGTSEFFKENILENQVFGSNIVFITTTTQALNKVGKFLEDGAIYYASASEIIKQCTVKTLPISRHRGSALISPEIGISHHGDKCQRQHNKLNLEVLQNGEYPLTRRLFVIIKQNGQVDEQAGEAYASLLLTREGQKLTEKAEFIPMR